MEERGRVIKVDWGKGGGGWKRVDEMEEGGLRWIGEREIGDLGCLVEGEEGRG